MLYRDARYSLKATQKSTEKVRRKYGESTEKVAEVIAKDPFMKTKEIAARANLSQSAVDKIIRKLKTAGVLKRIGPDKGGHWLVLSKQTE